MKKMKKRRELDALVNGKTSASHRKKTKGQHELLRDDSESSDIEEFSIPDQTIVRKRTTSSRACATCLMGCGFFLLMACLVAVVGLVWVHVELKRDVDALQANLRRLEMGSANMPDQFQQLHTAQQQLDEKLQALQQSQNKFDVVQNDVTKALLQIERLNETTKSLSKRLAATAAMENLPETLQSLQKSTADGMSNYQRLGTDVKELQNSVNADSATLKDLQAQIEALSMGKNDPEAAKQETPDAEIKEQSSDTTSATVLNKHYQEELNRQSAALTAVNASLQQKLDNMMKQHLHNTVLLGEVQNATELVGSRVGLLEVGMLSSHQNNNVSLPDMQTLVAEAVSSVMEELRNASIDSGAEAVSVLQDRLDALSNDMSNNTLLDALAQKQKLIVDDVSILQNSVSKLSNTVISNEQRIHLVESAQHDDHDDADMGPTHADGIMDHEDQEEAAKDHKAEGEEVKDESTEEAPEEQKPAQGLTDDDVTDNADDGKKGTVAPEAEKNMTKEAENGPTTAVSDAVEREEEEEQTASPKPAVDVPWIKTQEDGRTNFYRWDQDGDDYVKYSQLQDFLGPYTPEEKALKPYDEDNDNRYDLNEILAAFGLPPYTPPKLSFEDQLDKSNTTHLMEFAEPPEGVKKLPFSAIKPHLPAKQPDADDA